MEHRRSECAGVFVRREIDLVRRRKGVQGIAEVNTIRTDRRGYHRGASSGWWRAHPLGGIRSVPPNTSNGSCWIGLCQQKKPKMQPLVPLAVATHGRKRR